MAGPTQLRNAKRKAQAGQDMKGRPKKLKKSFKKQTDYDSGSGDDEEIPADQDFKAVNLADSEDQFDADEKVDKKTATQKNKDTHIAADSDDDDEMNDEPNLEDLSGSEGTDASNSDSESDEEAEESDTPQDPNHIKIRNKRHDPEAFATSMSKILGSKLSASKRSDPVLARSINAAQASKEITDLALEKKARQKMREDKKAAMDKGRVKDVRGASTAFDSAMGDGEPTETVQAIMEEEKRLRKTAQRGVVRMFNAVRAAQIKGEQAAREARQGGLVGHGRREEKVNEMSKQGFLELISGGGGGLKSGGIQEA